MYERFFNFTETPFNLTPDPRFFFSSPKHEDAFSQILYGIQERKGFIVLTGEVGTGKTTLCRLLLDRLDAKIKTSLIFNPNLTTVELLQAINQDFGIASKSQSKRELLDELNRFLLSGLSQRGNAVLIVDEAQNLTIDCLEEIRLLSNLETPKEKLLQILLVGQPELRDKLVLQELRQVNQRVSLRYHLDPLDLTETENYIGYRLKVAGDREGIRFTPRAIDMIHRLTHGIPRLINLLCDKALLAAYVAETKVINATLVDRAQIELEGKPSKAPIASSSKRAQLDPAVIRPIAWRGGTVAALLLLGVLLWWWKVPGTPTSSLPEPNAQAHMIAESGPVVPPSGDAKTKNLDPARSEFGMDADGIFRISDPKQADIAAYLTLLSQWEIEPEIQEEDLSGLVPEVLIQQAGLKSYTVPLDWQKLRLLDYPALIQINSNGAAPPHEAVLVGLSADGALVLDPLDGKWTPRREELERRWTGQAVLLWKELDGISLPVNKEDAGSTSVKNLQRVLSTEGFYLGKVDGAFGPATHLAMKFFQQKMGLKDDGVLDLESYLVLAKITQQEDVPNLHLLNAE
jgi:general secretion pathway protein A